MANAKQPVSNNIKCPFCGTSFYRSDLSFVSSRFYLKRLKNRLEIYPLGKNVAASTKLKRQHPELLRIEMSACPNCHRITVRAVGIGDQYPHHRVFRIYPRFDANPLPAYVPDQIRQDYKEANEVAEISPNSAAMLSRRILEEIIVDFYHIQEGDLFHDLDRLRQTKNNPRVWQAIDSIRRLGNIGVHQTNNVNNVFGNVSVKGAKEIIGLIRMVIHDTYVEAHLSRHLEKSVIRSAKKLNYQPHYYLGDDDYRDRHTKNRSRYTHLSIRSRRQRHDHRNGYHNHHSSRQHTRRNYRRRSRHTRHPNHRKSHRAKSRRYRRTKSRRNHKRRSTRRGKKNRVKDKSFTIIQGK